MTKRYLLCLILTIFLIAKTALGYVDPGTTGMIISRSIWPFVVGIFIAFTGFCIRYFRLIKRRFIRFYQKIKGKD